EYRQAIATEPKLVIAYMNLGNALQAKGKLDQAIAQFREALRIEKDQNALRAKGGGRDEPGPAGQVHYNLGNALRAKGDLNGAIAEYQEAIRLDYPGAHLNLGVALQAKGQVDEAIA